MSTAEHLSYEPVNVTINGISVRVSPHASILEAAREAGIYIPVACEREDIDLSGGHLCAVTVEGVPGLQNACSTVVRPGMAVSTETPRVWSTRRRRLAKLAAVYEDPCLECPRLEPCDSTVCGRKHLPAEHRCSTCDQIAVCELRQAARHIQQERTLLQLLRP